MSLYFLIQKVLLLSAVLTCLGCGSPRFMDLSHHHEAANFSTLMEGRTFEVASPIILDRLWGNYTSQYYFLLLPPSMCFYYPYALDVSESFNWEKYKHANKELWGSMLWPILPSHGVKFKVLRYLREKNGDGGNAHVEVVFLTGPLTGAKANAIYLFLPPGRVTPINSAFQVTPYIREVGGE